MFERFTDRARKAMALANQEAERLQHEYLGTEHVLLGLVREGSGVAANVLHNLGVELRQVRLEVEKLLAIGPDVMEIERRPQTPRVMKAIEEAIAAARELGHNYVGTEHLLLGLIRERDGVAAHVLLNLGVTVDRVRKELLSLLGAMPANSEKLASSQDPHDLTEVAKTMDVPPDAPGASAVELLDLNRRVASIESAAGRVQRVEPLLKFLIAWLAAFSVIVLALLILVVLRSR
jgi:ATP-dependent Clp protease ATP-binding subunit ClpC